MPASAEQGPANGFGWQAYIPIRPPCSLSHLSIIQTPLLCKWVPIEEKKTLPSFHPVVMCADAWDSGDLSAVTYGIAGEMERAACLPIPHLLVGEAPSDLNH